MKTKYSATFPLTKCRLKWDKSYLSYINQLCNISKFGNINEVCLANWQTLKWGIIVLLPLMITYTVRTPTTLWDSWQHCGDSGYIVRPWLHCGDPSSTVGTLTTQWGLLAILWNPDYTVRAQGNTVKPCLHCGTLATLWDSWQHCWDSGYTVRPWLHCWNPVGLLHCRNPDYTAGILSTHLCLRTGFQKKPSHPPWTKENLGREQTPHLSYLSYLAIQCSA